MLKTALIYSGFLLAVPAVIAEALPGLQLASVYQGGVELSEYLVSQKYDGIRVFWDGKRLYSRAGNWVPLPPALIAQLPPFTLDAELWLGVQRFAQLQQLLQQPLSAPGYTDLKLMVFDAPHQAGTFAQRQQFLQRMLPQSDFVRLIPQRPLSTSAELNQLMLQVEQQGGEGLMLHRQNAQYLPGRVSHLLKVKSYADAEARVIAHVPGKGQFKGLLGALLVELPDGRRFKLGTGFSLAERQQPPALGRWVRFKYQGITHKGTPRFAVFMQELDDSMLVQR